MIHPAISRAYEEVMANETISYDMAMELMSLEGEDILDLVSLANKVKNRFAGRYSEETHACSIVNAKSGACEEDCKFCAQSAHYNTNVETYDLLDSSQLIAQGEEAYRNGAKEFGLVTAGTGYERPNLEFLNILHAIKEIKKRCPGMGVCGAFGILSEPCVKMLAETGISHYNINLQVNPDRWNELVSTSHHVEDRLTTISLLQKHGIRVCCGGILGLNEDRSDRVKLAMKLRELEVKVVPLNVLIPIDGTPAEENAHVPVSEIAKTFAIFRLIYPEVILKFAAGRETRMKDFQGFLMLCGANALLTGGYLTTRGREAEQDHELMEELKGFNTVKAEEPVLA